MTKILLDHIKKDQYATRRFQILTYFLWISLTSMAVTDCRKTRYFQRPKISLLVMFAPAQQVALCEHVSFSMVLVRCVTSSTKTARACCSCMMSAWGRALTPSTAGSARWNKKWALRPTWTASCSSCAPTRSDRVQLKERGAEAAWFKLRMCCGDVLRPWMR